MNALLFTAMAWIFIPAYCFARFWFWEVVELARRFVMTAGLVLVTPGSNVQLLLGLSVSVIYLVAFQHCKPMKEDADDWLQIIASLQIILTMAMGLALGWRDENTTFDRNMMGFLLISLNVIVFGLGSWTMLMTWGKFKKWWDRKVVGRVKKCCSCMRCKARRSRVVVTTYTVQPSKSGAVHTDG